MQQVVDSDFDGVDDDTDEFPNDPTKAFTLVSPGVGQQGTYAYEDLWPSKGDYDFNDLVLDYNTTYYLNADNDVAEIESTVEVRAKGGNLIQGFGLHLPGVAPSDIACVSGAQINTGSLSIGGNGTENGQTNAVIIFCDDIEQIITRAGGAFFNTVSANPEGTSTALTVTIVMSTPVDLNTVLNDGSVFAFKDRDEEIHMVDKEPTDLVDNSLFGTADDDSDPASGRYYRTAQNHPWAIQLSEQFDYPEEKVDIVQAYTNFANWAQSNGAANADWFTDAPGNRVGSNLYQ